MLLLFELCRRGGRSAPVKTTTIELAAELRVPQQTVSRWLAELEREKLIQREGKKLRLSKRACAEIEALAKALAALPPRVEKKKLILRGVVVRGLGEGAKFISIPGYSRQLRAALGWKPFPGTLNLRLDAESAKTKKRLESMNGIKVKSFVEGNKRFGSVKLFPCLIKAGRGDSEARGAVILPERSFYGESVLEVVSGSNLRSRLAVRDGSTVSVKPL